MREVRLILRPKLVALSRRLGRFLGADRLGRRLFLLGERLDHRQRLLQPASGGIRSGEGGIRILRTVLAITLSARDLASQRRDSIRQMGSERSLRCPT